MYESGFLTKLARGYGGALLFAVPMFLTMEMWWMGLYLSHTRVLVLAITVFPLLFGLASISGLGRSSSWKEVFVETVTAYWIGLTLSAFILIILGVLNWSDPWQIIGSVIIVQAPLAAFGALVARSELSGGEKSKKSGEGESSQSNKYFFDLVKVACGAFYLASNVAATTEMMLASTKMGPWHILSLAVLEVFIIHSFIYAKECKDQDSSLISGFSILIRYTMPSFVLALLISGGLLWVFERYESGSLETHLFYILVLALPASVGGAAGRLIF